MSWAKTQYEKKKNNEVLRTKRSEKHSDKRESRTMNKRFNREVEREIEESFYRVNPD
jgi:hypothetical protein